MSWLWLVALLVGVDLLVTAVLLWRALKRRRLIARLRRAEPPAVTAELPGALRRYAEACGAEPGARGLVRLKQHCELRFAPDQSWHEMEAVSLVATGSPGFVWQASMKVGPLPLVQVVDAFVEGRGFLDARLLSLLPLAAAKGAAADRAEAIRYLAELPWAPDALLSVPGLTWQEVDSETVAVELPSGGGAARVSLRFGEDGSVTARSEARPRATSGGLVPTPWEARLWNPQQLGGRRLPSEGEAAWLLPEGRFVYWRGRLTDYRSGC